MHARPTAACIAAGSSDSTASDRRTREHTRAQSEPAVGHALSVAPRTLRLPRREAIASASPGRAETSSTVSEGRRDKYSTAGAATSPAPSTRTRRGGRSAAGGGDSRLVACKTPGETIWAGGAGAAAADSFCADAAGRAP
eukprot:scaffold2875_cov120-Isochrysis_galbana.AAC.2